MKLLKQRLKPQSSSLGLIAHETTQLPSTCCSIPRILRGARHPASHRHQYAGSKVSPSGSRHPIGYLFSVNVQVWYVGSAWHEVYVSGTALDFVENRCKT